ncbi:MAG: response regulator [Verrucomicrobiota bacterium]
MDKKILIIEDDYLMGKTLSIMVDRIDYIPVQTNSGKDALAALREDETSSIIVAIIDLNLPGENGADLLGSIKMARPNLSAILCTGMVDDPIANVSYDLFGFDNVLKKPFSEEDFGKVVRKVIDEQKQNESVLA